MRKSDLILIVIIVVAAGGLYFSGMLRPHEIGAEAVIYSNGNEYKRLSLSENTEFEVNINGDINIVKIFNGEADIIDANCPDKICVSQKNISLVNQTLVCLPHKVVVEIEGSQESEIDAVAN